MSGAAYGIARERMLERLRRRGFGVAMLDALARVPRHAFLPSEYANVAYGPHDVVAGDASLPSAETVARLLDTLDVAPAHRVLVDGSASGYEAAVAAQLAAEVVTRSVGERAQRAWRDAGIDNIVVAAGALPADGFARIAVVHNHDLLPPAILGAVSNGARAVTVVRGRLTAIQRSGDALVVEDGGELHLAEPSLWVAAPPEQCPHPIEGWYR